MNKRTSTIALSAFLFASIAGTAMAADLAPPPPPPPAPEIRPVVTDWTGPYLGAVAGVTCMETDVMHHTTFEDGVTVNDDDDFNDSGESWDGTSTASRDVGPYDMNGCGVSGGLVAGFNYQVGDIVLGLEGDFVWGGKTGKHQDANELDTYKVNWMASVRPRIGYLANQNTLFYITGGPGWLRGELKDERTGTNFERTHFGYVLGGGIEHALTENIHLRAEYLFSSYKDKTYGTYCATCATDGNPNTVSVDARENMDQFHTFRIGVTWNFPVSTW